MPSKYILLLFIVIAWTANPFLKKLVSKKFNSSEFMLINHFVISSMMLSYLVYLLYTKEFDFKCIQKLDKKDLGYLILGGITTIIGSLVMITLLSEYDASYIIPHLQPIVIVLTILCGYFIFNEELNKQKILGIILILSGIFAINYKGKK